MSRVCNCFAHIASCRSWQDPQLDHYLRKQQNLDGREGMAGKGGAECVAQIGKIYVLAFSSISSLSDESYKISHALTKSILKKRLMVSRTC